LSLADSVAVDPHKWLYSPVEAGCVLVRSYKELQDTFSYRPPYYPDADKRSGEPPIMYHEHGPQNSKGFRALKVWLALKQVGRQGYVRMISQDIQLARALYDLTKAHSEMEAFTHGLSVTTFRYVPEDMDKESEAGETYLNDLNREILLRLQNGGEVFVSNAVIKERFVLRACVVNFRTSLDDIEALPEIVCRVGRGADESMRPAELRR
jgi:glutamate/tyrosine decarboxylase-like PLP-dependent enzyme